MLRAASVTGQLVISEASGQEQKTSREQPERMRGNREKGDEGEGAEKSAET